MAKKKEKVVFGKLTYDEKCFFCKEVATTQAKCGRKKVAFSICCCSKKNCKKRATDLVRSQVKKNEIMRTVEAGSRKFLAN